MVIEKLFEHVKQNLDQQTQRIKFEPFFHLVNMFSSQEIEQKIERFFGLIDEDGNGELSWDEILNLCHKSF